MHSHSELNFITQGIANLQLIEGLIAEILLFLDDEEKQEHYKVDTSLKEFGPSADFTFFFFIRIYIN